MISGSIGKHGKFRLWRNVCQTTGCEVSGDDVPGVNGLVLEVMIPRGARVLYGLLGVRYSAAEPVTCGVDALTENARRFLMDENFLVAGFDSVCVGLPKLYEEAARAGFTRASNNGVEIEVDRLEMVYAAYGEVSSSERVFEQIGFVLANLMSGSCNGNVEGAINLMLTAQ